MKILKEDFYENASLNETSLEDKVRFIPLYTRLSETRKGIETLEILKKECPNQETIQYYVFKIKNKGGAIDKLRGYACNCNIYNLSELIKNLKRKVPERVFAREFEKRSESSVWKEYDAGDP
ncbi:MAG TPA: hypothetical protein PLK34_00515 [Candidatus Pacearchaeota archaeon]|nr:hypothetical protein [Candidatus Pacearchaeota archaeon]